MKPRKIELENFLETCRKTSRVLESIEAPVVTWAVRKEKVLGSFNRLMRKKRKSAEKLPESWHEMAVSQVAAGQVFLHPRRTRKFLRNYRDELGPEERSLLQHFIREPWFYAVLALEDTLEMGFFTVVDAETRDKLLLYSPAVQDISRTGAKLYLTLLFHNGECYQTFGPLHYHRGFQAYDFEYFAKQLSPLFYVENGLSATIANNPAAFLLLDTWTEFPHFVFRDEIVQICSDEISLDDFDPQKYSKDFDIDTKQEIVQCRLKGHDSPLRTAAVYYDRSKKKLFVQATSLELYRKIHSVLAEDFVLSEEPHWLASFNMNLAARQILDKEMPATSYVNMFEENKEPVSLEEQKHLDTLNAFIKELSRRRNEGIPCSLEELARKHGVDLEIARQAQEIYEKVTSKFDLDIDGGLEGYLPPPPIVREKFRLRPLAFFRSWASLTRTKPA